MEGYISKKRLYLNSDKFCMPTVDWSIARFLPGRVNSGSAHTLALATLPKMTRILHKKSGQGLMDFGGGGGGGVEGEIGAWLAIHLHLLPSFVCNTIGHGVPLLARHSS